MGNLLRYQTGKGQPMVSGQREDEVGGTRAIGRALAVLGALRDAKGELAFTEIVNRVDLNASTVHRILRALVSAGYVSKNPQERYRLAREAFLLGHAAEHGLGFDLVLPALERAAETTGESVNLVIRNGSEGVVVLRVESKQRLRFAQPVGTRIPLHCTSTGKVMLAFSDDPKAELAQLGRLSRETPATITSKRVLADELAAIRRTGYGVNRAERVPGVHGVAAPVRVADAPVSAAVAVQGPDIRMPEERIAELGRVVIDLAAEVATLLPAGWEM